MNTFHRVDATVAPALSGTLSISTSQGGKYFPPGDAHLTATPSSGYFFTGFTGDVTGTSAEQDINIRSPLAFTVNFKPFPTATVTTTLPAQESATITLKNVVANFAPSGTLSLYVANGGAASDVVDAILRPARALPIVPTNSGTGAVLAAQIDSITNIQAVRGQGTVSDLPSAPFRVGNLAPSASATVQALFN